jgi:hypothetical protein
VSPYGKLLTDNLVVFLYYHHEIPCSVVVGKNAKLYNTEHEKAR